MELFGSMDYADATLDFSYELNLTYNKEALVDHFDLNSLRWTLRR